MDHLKDGMEGQGGPTCGLLWTQGASGGMAVASQGGIFIQLKEPLGRNSSKWCWGIGSREGYIIRVQNYVSDTFREY